MEYDFLEPIVIVIAGYDNGRFSHTITCKVNEAFVWCESFVKAGLVPEIVEVRGDR